MRWDVVLCSCNHTLAWDADAVQRALGLAAPPGLYDRLPRDEMHAFAARVGGAPADRLLVACCAPPALFREIVGAAGGEPDAVTVVNAKETAFWPHAGPAGADAALRLLRGALEPAARPTPPPLAIKVGPRVLIATDSPAGLDLAARLADVAEPVLLLDERSAAFDAEFRGPQPWRTTWGRVARVEGTLGNFRVTVEREQPIDLDQCVYCRRCVPVCHTSAISEGLRLRLELCDQCGDCLKACADVGAIRIPRQATEIVRADQVVVVSASAPPTAPRRTGHHAVGATSADGVDAVAWKVLGLIGDFEKPQYVLYDPETCAGGAASRQACGRCIPACPYEAIARHPRNLLRVHVDGPACEGCGACVAACPTSSLSFTEPSPADLGRRLAALLAPLPDAAAGPPIVGFHCPERGAAALAHAARVRRGSSAPVLPVPMACLRHVSEADILQALRLGAAGVALLGCESCPHGEREALEARIELTRRVLDAFGVGAGRVRLVTGDDRAMLEALDALAGSAAAPPLAPPRDGAAAVASRDVFTAAVGALIETTKREPGALAVPASAPFASPAVRVAGCTLCRSCVNVCPTHAFRYDEDRQALELKLIDCVNCGLCAAACPESVITLRNALSLETAALDHQVVVQDETLRCARCNAPFGTKRAVEVIEAKVFGMANLLDTFAGSRRSLLRMCPNCRAVAAMQEIDKGWQP